MARHRRPSSVLALLALIGAAELGACSLNPQPIPPLADGVAESDAGATMVGPRDGSASGSGNGLDAGATNPNDGAEDAGIDASSAASDAGKPDAADGGDADADAASLDAGEVDAGTDGSLVTEDDGGTG